MTLTLRNARTIALLAAVLCAAGACKDKNKDKGPGGSGGASGGTPASVAGLAAVPAAARVVVGADIQRLAASELVQRAVQQMFLRDPELKTRIDGLIEACDVEPGKDLKSFVIGMGEGEDVVLVATGSFDEEKISVCVDKNASGSGGRVTTRSHEGRTLYRVESSPDKTDVWFAFGNESTLLVSSTESWLKTALASGPKADSEPGLAALVQRARPGDAALWAAGSVPAEVGAGLVKTSGGKVSAPKRMFGHLNLESGLVAELGAIMADEQQAKSLISYAEPQMELLALAANARQLGRFVSALTLDHDGDTAYLRVSLSREQLHDLVSRIDKAQTPEQNPALDAGQQGAVDDAHRDAASGGQAPVRQQRQVD